MVFNSINFIKVPMALVLIIKFLDINILTFALVLVTIDLLIDYAIYLNSAPVTVPKRYSSFTKNVTDTTIRWIVFICIFWILGSVICAILEYLGITHANYIIELVDYTLLSVLLLHDLHKLKYTRYYQLPIVKIFVDKIYTIFNIIDQEKQSVNNQLKERKE